MYLLYEKFSKNVRLLSVENEQDGFLTQGKNMKEKIKTSKVTHRAIII